MVKPDVKKGDEVHFLARCHVNAEMNKKEYLFYVGRYCLCNMLFPWVLVAVVNMKQLLCITSRLH